MQERQAVDPKPPVMGQGVEVAEILDVLGDLLLRMQQTPSGDHHGALFHVFDLAHGPLLVLNDDCSNRAVPRSRSDQDHVDALGCKGKAVLDQQLDVDRGRRPLGPSRAPQDSAPNSAPRTRLADTGADRRTPVPDAGRACRPQGLPACSAPCHGRAASLRSSLLRLTPRDSPSLAHASRSAQWFLPTSCRCLSRGTPSSFGRAPQPKLSRVTFE